MILSLLKNKAFQITAAVLLLIALTITGFFLWRDYEDRHEKYDALPAVVLQGNLYVTSADKEGLVYKIPPAEQERYGYREIGAVQETVPSDTFPEKDFSSNFDAVGATVYLSADAQHAFVTVEEGLLRFDRWENETRAPYEASSR